MSTSLSKKNIRISIVIVHYKVKKKLFECLKSINKQTKNITFEIIVVDNDEKKTIVKDLKKYFPTVKYIPSTQNVGYGAGINLGANEAKGEYLFILNPDTILLNNSAKLLVDFLDRNKRFAIIAPLLHDSNGEVYPLQGTEVLTPIKAIFSLSFVSRILPNNTIAKKYWLKNWKKKNVKEVGTVPGTAFLIRKKVFDYLGGFDKKFFLYFEEHDLSLRILQAKYKIGINPQAKIIHHWAQSTARSEKNIKKIFEKSRFYYFKKHYGIVSALLTETILRFGKIQFFLGSILLLGLILRFYLLFETFYIIPDGGWFYLSARDMLLTGEIPLVGPPTSHPWIHHGPLWTYALAGILLISRFNPLVPAYFMAVLGVITVYVMYKTSSLLFNEKVGLISAFLYSVSPLVITNSRNPYHTSPIPFFSLLFLYAINKWVKSSNPYYILLITFLIGVMYNHEITTVAISGIFVMLLVFGWFKKKKYFINLLRNKKIIGLSFVSFLIPMTPFILHDFTHGFRQTGGFLVWMVYRLVRLPFDLLRPNPDGSAMTLNHPEFAYFIKSVFFYPNLLIALLLLMISLLYIPIYLLFFRKKQDYMVSKIILTLFLFIPLAGLFTHRVPIEADVMLIAPFLIISLGYFVSLLSKKKFYYFGFVLLVIIAGLNTFGFITEQKNEAKINYVNNMPLQYDASKRIIELSQSSPYNLKGKGVLDNYPVFTMPYEYLTWWMGKAPSKEKTEREIIVSPQGTFIDVYINEETKK